MEKMGTLKKNGDQKTNFGPHGDQSPQMGTKVPKWGPKWEQWMREGADLGVYWSLLVQFSFVSSSKGEPFPHMPQNHLFCLPRENSVQRGHGLV